MTAQVLPPADEESGGPVEAVEQLTSEYTTVTEQLQTTQTQLTEVITLSCEIVLNNCIGES